MRSMLVAVVVTLASLVAVPAFAAPRPASDNAPAKTQRAEGDKAGKHFPMPAAEFKAKVDKRMAKSRARMEERVAKMSPAEAKEARAKFDTVAANVNAEVAKAVADGTVTHEEAKAVRAANPHHGKHARKGKKAARAK